LIRGENEYIASQYIDGKHSPCIEAKINICRIRPQGPSVRQLCMRSNILRRVIRSWYCLQVHPKADEIAEQGIRRLGIESFRPQMVVSEKEQDIIKNVFPGYVFVKFNKNEDHQWRTLWYIPGAKRILSSSAESPTKIKYRIIAALQAFHNLNAVDESAIKPGDNVEILSGPFKLFRGIAQRTEQERVFILLSLLGQNYNIEVAQSDVRLRHG
jgi:transcription antitermination factor NusG